MKRTVFILIVAIMLLPAVFSCQNTVATDTHIPPLDSAIELKMREDYLKYVIDRYGENEALSSLDDVWVQWYGGNYGGCEVVVMGDKGYPTVIPMPQKIEIAGYTFAFGSSWQPYVYEAAKFYTIKDAYEAGLITQNDVYNIWMQLYPDFAEQNPNPTPPA
ncbi:MAG: hypothetical protein FWF18_04710 [Dehalococcoidia bacterium]|nr:hypothetical protein [Dehalococcoidia bacterium]